MERNELKQILQDAHVFQWELADALGLAESALCKRLRYSISEDFEAEILQAIKQLKERTE